MEKGCESIGMSVSQVFIPFLSVSEHLCLGRSIAETEAYLILQLFTKLYDFKLCSDFKEKYTLVLSVEQCMMEVSRRI